jgi:ribulose-5-phosphate 4-epimerase/fuculose-1-phosphate aldolase
LNLGRDIDPAWKNTELLEKVSKIYYAALITGREISLLPEKIKSDIFPSSTGSTAQQAKPAKLKLCNLLSYN